MIHPERFYQYLSGKGIDFFTGVPDSLLKSLLLYFHKNINPSNHIITANEGLAIALASGYHISTGKIPVVYMQNSGLGNAINPLTSLASAEVYAIPMILLIGWRGMPGKKDEPQHTKMGQVTDKLLQMLDIPFFILEEDEEKSFAVMDTAITLAVKNSKPVALLIPGELFDDPETQPPSSIYPLGREMVIQKLIDHFTDEVVVCTTGKSGREFFELNRQRNQPIAKTFLAVGSMGLANHTALGIDMHSGHRVVMIDGDGAVLMHMGSLADIGKWASSSFVHIVINNGSHESVGAQPTLGFDIDFCAIAKACGYASVYSIEQEHELSNWLSGGFHKEEKQLVEIRVNNTSRSNLGRPTNSPAQRKDELMRVLRNK
ncbi:MAG: phosphonopyruvate decarboxylase [Chitinophagaceae bacterium]|nr:phosphonopyruvate decarboxylase [Chitinophagaceae bacterium]